MRQRESTGSVQGLENDARDLERGVAQVMQHIKLEKRLENRLRGEECLHRVVRMATEAEAGRGEEEETILKSMRILPDASLS